MEQTELITQAARLINSASEYQGKGEPRAAHVRLNELQELLNNKLDTEAPAEPDLPEATEPT